MLEIGQKFGCLTVLDVGEKRGGHWYYNFKCECGKEKKIRGSSVSSGNTKTCGCQKGMVRFADKIIPKGTRFGSMTVVELTETPPHIKNQTQRFYRCVCDCEKERVIRASKLNAGECKCDCVIREQIDKTREEKLSQTERVCSQCKTKKNIEQFGFRAQNIRHGICRNCKNKQKREWAQNNKDKTVRYAKNHRETSRGKLTEIRASAKARNLDFDLTEKQFDDIATQACHYCNKENTTRGLDRVDNSRGYLMDNVVSCCKTCNFMKHTLGQDEFFAHIKCLYNHLLQEGLLD